MITNLNNSVHVAYAFLTCCMKKDIEVSGGISTKLNVLHCIILFFNMVFWCFIFLENAIKSRICSNSFYCRSGV